MSKRDWRLFVSDILESIEKLRDTGEISSYL